MLPVAEGCQNIAQPAMKVHVSKAPPTDIHSYIQRLRVVQATTRPEAVGYRSEGARFTMARNSNIILGKLGELRSN